MMMEAAGLSEMSMHMWLTMWLMSQLQRQLHSSLPWEPHIWLRVYLNIEIKLCALVPQIDMYGFWLL